MKLDKSKAKQIGLKLAQLRKSRQSPPSPQPQPLPPSQPPQPRKDKGNG